MSISNCFLYGDFQWGTNTKKHFVFEEDASLLNEVLSELFNEKEEFSQFINSVSFSSITSSLKKNFFRKLVIAPNDLVFTSESEDGHTDPTESMWNLCHYDSITFCDFSLKTLDEMFKRSKRSTDNIETRLLKSYDPSFANPDLAIRSKAINIDSRMTGFSGGFINMNSIISLVESNCKNAVDVDKFIFIGKTNSLLAMIFVNGTLVVRWPTLKRIMIKHSRDILKNTLRSLLDIFVPFNLRFQAVNMEGYKKDILTSVFAKANLHYSSLIFKKANEESQEDYKKRINAIVKDCKEYIDNRVDSITSTKMEKFVSELLANVFDRVRQDVKKFKDEAYETGYKFGSILANSGWKAETKSSSLAWSKTVSIKPDKFIYKGQMYLIPENKRTVHVSSITVYSHGGMSATNTGVAHHPNMSGDRVCTGDLKLNLSDTTPEELMEVLTSAEKLLEIINFDSAYHGGMLSSIGLESSKQIEGAGESLRNKMLNDASRKKSGLKRKLVRKTDETNEDSVLPEEKIESEPVGTKLPKAGVVLPSASEVAKGNKDSNSVYVQRLEDMSRTIRDIERGNYSTLHVIDVLTDETNALWLHPNGISIVGLWNDAGYSVPFYKKSRNIKAVQISNLEFNKLIPLCKLIQVGNLANSRYDWSACLSSENYKLFKTQFSNRNVLSKCPWVDMWHYLDDCGDVSFQSPYYKTFYDRLAESQPGSQTEVLTSIPANETGEIEYPEDDDDFLEEEEDIITSAAGNVIVTSSASSDLSSTTIITG